MAKYHSIQKVCNVWKAFGSTEGRSWHFVKVEYEKSEISHSKPPDFCYMIEIYALKIGKFFIDQSGYDQQNSNTTPPKGFTLTKVQGLCFYCCPEEVNFDSTASAY